MMKKSFTRRNFVVLCVVLCIAMLLCAVTLNEKVSYNTAYASSEASTTENLTFSLINNGTEYRVNAKNRQITEAIIPASYNGLPVTEIMDNGFISCTKLTKVYIPNTVTKIGNNAFTNCSMLEEVNGMSKVETLGNNAFSMCKKLNNLILPPTISTLGSSILRSNPNTVYSRLSSDEMTAMNPNWKLNTDTTKYVYGNDIVFNEVYEGDVLKGYAVQKEQLIYTEDDIVLGDTIVYKGETYDLLEIGNQAFFTSTFNSFTLKHGEMTIVDEESENATVLNEEGSDVCNHKVNIASSAFMVAFTKEINFLVDITFDDHNVDQSECFDFEKGHSIDVFSGCPDLEKVTLPDNITIIPRGAFSGCENLTQIIFNSTEENINRLSDNIISIGSQAFFGCSSLTDLYMPDVHNMGESVFQSWGGQKNIKQAIHFEEHYFHPPVGEDGYNWNQDWIGTLEGDVNIQFKLVRVSFDKNKGTGGSDYIDIYYGQSMPEALAPERTGYSFEGYKYNNKQYYDAEMNGFGTWDVTDNVPVLTAQWKQKEYTVILNEQEYVTQNITAKFDDSMPPQNAPVRIGYEFKGYFTQPDGQGDKYYDEDMISVCNWDIDSDEPVNLYAYWIQKNYTITFDKQGGTGGTDLLEGVHYGDVFPNAEKPKMVGYAFNGYYTNTGEIYYTSEMLPTRTNYNIDGDIMLYAEWKLVNYNIYYQLDGGTQNSENPQQFNINDHITLKDPTHSSLKFLGWIYKDDYIENLDGIIENLDEGETRITIVADWLSIVHVNSAVSEIHITEKKASIWFETEFDTNCTIYVSSNTTLLGLDGYGRIYNMNIVVDRPASQFALLAKNIGIYSHSNQPAIYMKSSGDLYLYTLGIVNIFGTTKSDGNGSEAIVCGSLYICSTEEALVISGGDGKEGVSYGTIGTRGGNGGVGVQIDKALYILCNNVLIYGGTPGDGGDGTTQGGYGGKGAYPVGGTNSNTTVIRLQGLQNVHLYRTMDGEDGANAGGNKPVTPILPPGAMTVPDTGIGIPPINPPIFIK